jgi:hypothetical protein
VQHTPTVCTVEREDCTKRTAGLLNTRKRQLEKVFVFESRSGVPGTRYQVRRTVCTVVVPGHW